MNNLSPSSYQLLRNGLIAAGLAPLAATCLVNLVLSPARMQISRKKLMKQFNTSHSAAFPMPPIDKIKTVSNTAGFVALELVAAQILLGSRFPLFEKVFGFDRVMLQHRKIAYTAGAMAALHLGLKAYNKSKGSKKPVTAFLSYCFSLVGFRPYIYGRVAFWGSLVVSLVAYFQKQPNNIGKVPWYIWKSLHYLLYGFMALIYLHSWTAGSLSYPRPPRAPRRVLGFAAALYDLKQRLFKEQSLGVTLKRSAFWALFSATTVTSLWRWYSRWSRDALCVWQIVSVEKETLDVTRVRLAPPAHQRSFSSRKPGQFAIIRKQVSTLTTNNHSSSLSSPSTSSGTTPPPESSQSSSTASPSSSGQFGWVSFIKRPASLKWSEPHPFTLSGPVNDLNIEFTIKSMPNGQFSPTVPSWKVGEAVLVEGPFGIFTPRFDFEPNIVMVAGGVGITPFLSILRESYCRDRKSHSFTLIWGIKDKNDLAFLHEFAAMATTFKEFRLCLVLSNPNALADLESDPLWKTIPPVFRNKSVFQSGFVNSEILQKFIEPEKATYYMCGPPAMKTFVKPQLCQLYGLAEADVHFELFSW